MKKSMIVAWLAASALLVAGCGRPPTETQAGAQPQHAAQTQADAGGPPDAELRISLKKDGAFSHVEGKKGGNWQDGGLFGPNPPPSIGEKLATIEVWTDNGTWEGPPHAHPGGTTAGEARSHGRPRPDRRPGRRLPQAAALRRSTATPRCGPAPRSSSVGRTPAGRAPSAAGG